MRAHANTLKTLKPLTFAAPAPRRKKPALLTPRVVPVYWDARFQKHPIDITVFDEFLRALFQSSWMTELEGAGVGPAQLLPSFVPNSPPWAKLTRQELESTVMDWAHRGIVTPGPGSDSEELFYVVFARFKTQPSGVHGSRCVPVPLLDVGPDLLEVHSATISGALATAFAERSAGFPLTRTSPTRRGLPSRR